MSDFRYRGSELGLFACARNWKAYWSGRIHACLAGDVLEVGAGIGSNTLLLAAQGEGRWVCLEPDPRLISQLRENLDREGPRRKCETVCGTIQSLASGEEFDTIIYLDVLEHIEDDRGELSAAAARLRPGGRIVVLSPAHQFLFSPFDGSVGHLRRYNRPMLRAITPAGLHLERLFYLDSAGLLLSAANRLVLRQSLPTAAQLRFWDTWVIRASRVLDVCLLHSIGKSIVAVWCRDKAPA